MRAPQSSSRVLVDVLDACMARKYSRPLGGFVMFAPAKEASDRCSRLAPYSDLARALEGCTRHQCCWVRLIYGPRLCKYPHLEIRSRCVAGQPKTCLYITATPHTFPYMPFIHYFLHCTSLFSKHQLNFRKENNNERLVVGHLEIPVYLMHRNRITRLRSRI
jgi:hypothetical protein